MYAYAYVILCIEFSGKKGLRQMGMGRVMTSGSLGDVTFSTLSQNARGVHLKSALIAIFRNIHRPP